MNTGAILNRINFGMAVAANRIPGASVGALPGIDTLRAATRASQVDAVVSALLSGSTSPDTRAVLMKGENPLASNLADNQAPAVSMGDAVATDNQDMRPNAARRINAFPGKNGARAGQLAGGLGPVPQLSGVAQIVGLALGSPEFQRR